MPLTPTEDANVISKLRQILEEAIAQNRYWHSDAVRHYHPRYVQRRRTECLQELQLVEAEITDWIIHGAA